MLPEEDISYSYALPDGSSQPFHDHPGRVTVKVLLSHGYLAHALNLVINQGIHQGRNHHQTVLPGLPTNRQTRTSNEEWQLRDTRTIPRTLFLVFQRRGHSSWRTAGEARHLQTCTRERGGPCAVGKPDKLL